MDYCEKCGAQNPDNSKFCYACGEKMQGKPKPVKKGCGKSAMFLLVIVVVVIALFIWGIASLTGGSGGGGNGTGNDGDQQETAKFERVMSERSVDSLTTANRFKKDNGDVVPKAGRYEGISFGEKVYFDVVLAQNGTIVGKVYVEMGGSAIRDNIFAYCGNGIYALYNGERIYDNPDEYFQALADHETIDWKGVIVTYTGPVPSEGGMESGE